MHRIKSSAGILLTLALITGCNKKVYSNLKANPTEVSLDNLYGQSSIETSTSGKTTGTIAFLGDVHDNPNYDLATNWLIKNELTKPDVIFLEAFYDPQHFKTKSVVGDLAGVAVTDMSKEQMKSYFELRKFDWYPTKYQ
ncbi:MAG: hypothetical protein HQK54_12595, partial [Oligoflexales bacterium]|nr:hypothetical protein [Oligoflexales bacterium]